MDSIVNAIVELLQSKGSYRTLMMPLKLGDMTFRFDAALLGPEGYGDIVLVSSLTDHPGPVLQRRMTAFVTLLDRQYGKRSVTLVLVARGEISSENARLEQFCRVLLVTPTSQLEAVLRPLLRLILPAAGKSVEVAETVLAHELDTLRTASFVSAMVEASQLGEDEVRQVIFRALAEATQLRTDGENHE